MLNPSSDRSLGVPAVRKRGGGCFTCIRVQRPRQHSLWLDTCFCVLDILLPGNSAGQDGFRCDASPCLEWQDHRSALVYHCGCLRFRDRDHSYELAHSVWTTNRQRHPGRMRVAGYAHMDPCGKCHRHHLHGCCSGVCALEDRQQDLYSKEREMGRCYLHESCGSICCGMHCQVSIIHVYPFIPSTASEDTV